MSEAIHMTGRERVHATVEGLPVDRVPVMYFLNPHLTCRIIATHTPARHLRWNIMARGVWKLFNRGGASA